MTTTTTSRTENLSELVGRRRAACCASSTLVSLLCATATGHSFSTAGPLAAAGRAHHDRAALLTFWQCVDRPGNACVVSVVEERSGALDESISEEH